MADKNLFEFELTFPSYRDKGKVSVPASSEEEARNLVASQYDRARMLQPDISPTFSARLLGVAHPTDITAAAIEQNVVSFTLPHYYDEIILNSYILDSEGNQVPAFDPETPPRTLSFPVE